MTMISSKRKDKSKIGKKLQKIVKIEERKIPETKLSEPVEILQKELSKC